MHISMTNMVKCMTWLDTCQILTTTYAKIIILDMRQMHNRHAMDVLVKQQIVVATIFTARDRREEREIATTV